MKVVINDCHGGFSLSPKGEEAYLRRKGEEAFFYVNQRVDGRIGFDSFERFDPQSAEPWFVVHTFTKDMGDTFTKDDWPANDEGYVYLARQLPRNDPDLVAVVEELGEAANGAHARLKVIEIPDDVEWEIEEYDGMEWIAEAHRVWR